MPGLSTALDSASAGSGGTAIGGTTTTGTTMEATMAGAVVVVGVDAGRALLGPTLDR